VKSPPIGAAKVGPTQSIAFAEPAMSRDLPRPGMRGYPRHARSLSARAMRQRMLLIALALALATAGSIIVGPQLFSGSKQQDPLRIARRPNQGQIAAALARTEAAIWIHRWVAANADVACDPLMCQTLAAHGTMWERILDLSTSATDPIGADVVVATLTIRTQFGSRLATVYAPAVLASFGKGDAEVDVRVVGNGTSYLKALRADLSARKLAGTALLHNPGVSATGTAARELADGEVDSRLLTNLAALAHWGCPVTVLSFGGRGPRATAGMPLLSADITPLVGRPGVRLTASRSHAEILGEVNRIVRFFNTQITPLRPASFAPVAGPGGQIVVQVDFSAPAQFGIFDGIPVETNSSSVPER
jgi:hypothetical protein